MSHQEFQSLLKTLPSLIYDLDQLNLIKNKPKLEFCPHFFCKLSNKMPHCLADEDLMVLFCLTYSDDVDPEQKYIPPHYHKHICFQNYN